MTETVTTNQRVYIVLEPVEAGRIAFRFSLKPPEIGTALAALLVRGLIMDGSALDVEFVSNPKADPDLRGPDGPNGWTPILSGDADGTRTLLKVIDWTGGKGTKPPLGYVGGPGASGLVAKADAFNFNAVKRVDIFSAQSDASGIATITFDPAFARVPAKALPTAIPNLLAGPIKAEMVAGSLTKTGCQVKVTQQSPVSGVITALAGASVNVIAIEA